MSKKEFELKTFSSFEKKSLTKKFLFRNYLDSNNYYFTLQ